MIRGELRGDLPRPFLRWAGGKRWLIPTLTRLVSGASFVNYHEPFLGGGSIFLGLPMTGKAYLQDLNAELIETYEAIRLDPDAVHKALVQHANTADHYYAVRDFYKPRTLHTRAARFIYLNHTSFNGIYRVNLQGRYNVPYGYRTNPIIPDRPQLRAVAARLQAAVLEAGDFGSCLDNVGEADLIFLDPPYTVAHNNNGFVKYNQKLFSFADQCRLGALIDEIKARGAYYVMTNAAHSSIADLFDKGDETITTTRRNVIGGARAARGAATELLFTNVPGHVR